MDAWFFNAVLFGIPLLGLFVMYSFRQYFKEDSLLEEFKKTKAQLIDPRAGGQFAESCQTAVIAPAETRRPLEPVAR